MLFKRENALKELCSKWKQDSLYVKSAYKDFKVCDNFYTMLITIDVNLFFHDVVFKDNDQKDFTHICLTKVTYLFNYVI